MKRPAVVVALLTPLVERGGIDDGAVGAHVDFLVEAGVDALMPCGTTGEGPLLPEDELWQMLAATVEAARGRVPVIFNVPRPDTESAVIAVRRAPELGAGAVSAVVPYYYAFEEEQILRHYRAVLEAAHVPVYAYTIPARTGNDLSADAVRSLGADGLRGVKDSTKSWERHLEYLECGVDVLIGTDGMVLDAFRAGAAGCVSALANVRPDLLCALRDGAGEEVQEQILQLRSELPMQKLKTAVAAQIAGYPTTYRSPLG